MCDTAAQLKGVFPDSCDPMDPDPGSPTVATMAAPFAENRAGSMATDNTGVEQREDTGVEQKEVTGVEQKEEVTGVEQKVEVTGVEQKEVTGVEQKEEVTGVEQREDTGVEQREDDDLSALDLYLETVEADGRYQGVVVPPSPWHVASDCSMDIMYSGLGESPLAGMSPSTTTTRPPASPATCRKVLTEGPECRTEAMPSFTSPAELTTTTLPSPVKTAPASPSVKRSKRSSSLSTRSLSRPSTSARKAMQSSSTRESLSSRKAVQSSSTRESLSTRKAVQSSSTRESLSTRKAVQSSSTRESLSTRKAVQSSSTRESLSTRKAVQSSSTRESLSTRKAVQSSSTRESLSTRKAVQSSSTRESLSTRKAVQSSSTRESLSTRKAVQSSSTSESLSRRKAVQSSSTSESMSPRQSQPMRHLHRVEKQSCQQQMQWDDSLCSGEIKQEAGNRGDYLAAAMGDNQAVFKGDNQELMARYQQMRSNMVLLCVTARREMQHKDQVISQLRKALNSSGSRCWSGLETTVSDPAQVGGVVQDTCAVPQSSMTSVGSQTVEWQPLPQSQSASSQLSCVSVPVIDKQTQTKSWRPIDKPTQTDALTPVDKPTQTVSLTPVDKPTQTDALTSVNKPTQTDALTPVDKPTQTVSLTPVNKPTQTVSLTPVNKPTQTVSLTPVNKPTQTASLTSVNKQVQTESGSNMVVDQPVLTGSLRDTVVDEPGQVDESPVAVDPLVCADSVVDQKVDEADHMAGGAKETVVDSSGMQSFQKGVESLQPDGRGESPGADDQNAMETADTWCADTVNSAEAGGLSGVDALNSAVAAAVSCDRCEEGEGPEDADGAACVPSPAEQLRRVEVDQQPQSAGRKRPMGQVEVDQQPQSAGRKRPMGQLPPQHVGGKRMRHTDEDEEDEGEDGGVDRERWRAGDVTGAGNGDGASPGSTDTVQTAGLSPCPQGSPRVWGPLRAVQGDAWKSKLLLWLRYHHCRVSRREEINAVFSGQHATQTYDWTHMSWPEPPLLSPSHHDLQSAAHSNHSPCSQPDNSPCSQPDNSPCSQPDNSPCSQPDNSPCSQPDQRSPCSQPDHHSPCSQPDHHSPCSQPDHHSPCSLPDHHSPCSQPDLALQSKERGWQWQQESAVDLEGDNADIEVVLESPQAKMESMDFKTSAYTSAAEDFKTSAYTSAAEDFKNLHRKKRESDGHDIAEARKKRRPKSVKRKAKDKDVHQQSNSGSDPRRSDKNRTQSDSKKTVDIENEFVEDTDDLTTVGDRFMEAEKENNYPTFTKTSLLSSAGVLEDRRESAGQAQCGTISGDLVTPLPAHASRSDVEKNILCPGEKGRGVVTVNTHQDDEEVSGSSSVNTHQDDEEVSGSSSVNTHQDDEEVSGSSSVNTHQDDEEVSGSSSVNTHQDDEEVSGSSSVNTHQDDEEVSGSSSVNTHQDDEEVSGSSSVKSHQVDISGGGLGDSDISIHTDDSDSEEWSLKGSLKTDGLEDSGERLLKAPSRKADCHPLANLTSSSSTHRTGSDGDTCEHDPAVKKNEADIRVSTTTCDMDRRQDDSGAEVPLGESGHQAGRSGCQEQASAPGSEESVKLEADQQKTSKSVSTGPSSVTHVAVAKQSQNWPRIVCDPQHSPVDGVTVCDTQLGPVDGVTVCDTQLSPVDGVTVCDTQLSPVDGVTVCDTQLSPVDGVTVCDTQLSPVDGVTVCDTQLSPVDGVTVCDTQLSPVDGVTVCDTQLSPVDGVTVCDTQLSPVDGVTVCDTQLSPVDGVTVCDTQLGPVDGVTVCDTQLSPVDGVTVCQSAQTGSAGMPEENRAQRRPTVFGIEVPMEEGDVDVEEETQGGELLAPFGPPTTPVCRGQLPVTPKKHWLQRTKTEDGTTSAATRDLSLIWSPDKTTFNVLGLRQPMSHHTFHNLLGFHSLLSSAAGSSSSSSSSSSAQPGAEKERSLGPDGRGERNSVDPVHEDSKARQAVKDGQEDSDSAGCVAVKDRQGEHDSAGCVAVKDRQGERDIAGCVADDRWKVPVSCQQVSSGGLPSDSLLGTSAAVRRPDLEEGEIDSVDWVCRTAVSVLEGTEQSLEEGEIRSNDCPCPDDSHAVTTSTVGSTFEDIGFTRLREMPTLKRQRSPDSSQQVTATSKKAKTTRKGKAHSSRNTQPQDSECAMTVADDKAKSARGCQEEGGRKGNKAAREKPKEGGWRGEMALREGHEEEGGWKGNKESTADRGAGEMDTPGQSQTRQDTHAQPRQQHNKDGLEKVQRQIASHEILEEKKVGTKAYTIPKINRCAKSKGTKAQEAEHSLSAHSACADWRHSGEGGDGKPAVAGRSRLSRVGEDPSPLSKHSTATDDRHQQGPGSHPSHHRKHHDEGKARETDNCFVEDGSKGSNRKDIGHSRDRDNTDTRHSRDRDNTDTRHSRDRDNTDTRHSRDRDNTDTRHSKDRDTRCRRDREIRGTRHSRDIDMAHTRDRDDRDTRHRRDRYNRDTRHSRDREIRDTKYRRDRDTRHSRDRDTRHGKDRDTKHSRDRDTRHSKDRDTKHSRDRDTKHSRDRDTRHSNDRDTKHSRDRDTRHSNDRDTRHSRDRDTRHSNDRDTRHSRDRDTKHSRDRDTRHSNDRDTRHSRDRDTRHSNDRDTRHSRDRDTRHSKDRDTRHSKDRDTRHSKDRDTRHSNDRDTRHSRDRDTRHSKDRDTRHSKDRNTRHSKDRDTRHSKDRDSGATGHVKKGDVGRRTEEQDNKERGQRKEGEKGPVGCQSLPPGAESVVNPSARCAVPSTASAHGEDVDLQTGSGPPSGEQEDCTPFPHASVHTVREAGNLPMAGQKCENTKPESVQSEENIDILVNPSANYSMTDVDGSQRTRGFIYYRDPLKPRPELEISFEEEEEMNDGAGEVKDDDENDDTGDDEENSHDEESEDEEEDEDESEPDEASDSNMDDDDDKGDGGGVGGGQQNRVEEDDGIHQQDSYHHQGGNSSHQQRGTRGSGHAGFGVERPQSPHSLELSQDRSLDCLSLHPLDEGDSLL